MSEQQRDDYGYSGSITESVFRVEGGEIQEENAQEKVIRRNAWAVCVAEYQSDGKIDERPTQFRRKIEISTKTFRDRTELVKWSPDIEV